MFTLLRFLDGPACAALVAALPILASTPARTDISWVVVARVEGCRGPKRPHSYLSLAPAAGGFQAEVPAYPANPADHTAYLPASYV